MIFRLIISLQKKKSLNANKSPILNICDIIVKENYFLAGG
jgi:hypothetical protein